MENSFFPRTWRSKKIKTSVGEKNLPIGEYDLIRIEKKFIIVITEFIRNIFNYEKIEVNLTKKDTKDQNTLGYSSGSLESENGHTKYTFATKLFNDKFYEFSVAYIPATRESRHIQIFFRVLMQYLGYFYSSLQMQLPVENDKLIASSSFVIKSDIWLYNIERTIIIEYIYNLFNTYNENYSNEFKLVPKPLRYDLDLVNKILDFALELNTRKVENKEIYCGFIFHDNTRDIRNNSVLRLKFDKQFDFGDFGQLKNYIEVSNGQNIFFNVTKDKITHLFITADKVNEIILNPISHGKRFEKRPLILSVQGNGKIHFLEGGMNNNKMILQIINSKPIIRDNNFIKNFIFESLESFSSLSDEKNKVFSKWIMSLSQKKHGASLVFLNMNNNIENKMVKTQKISFSDNQFLESSNLRYNISLLNSIINPDGAVIFGSNLIPSHISTILPISQSLASAGGGARHNSVANFTKEFNCLGIVISEDGPISIFKNGTRLIKF